VSKLKELWFIAQAIINLAPSIMELIMKVEEVATTGGVVKAGAEKAGLVVGFIQVALEALPDEVRNAVPLDRITQVAKKLVDLVVTFYNATGIFKKS